MPSQQRFEGSNLEDLLTEVRDQFGPDVNILEANRIRTGGIGGFFTREGFEIVVENDREPEHAWDDDTEPVDALQQLLDLADAVHDGPDAVTDERWSLDAQPVLARSGASHGQEPLASESSVQRLLEKTADFPLPNEPSRGIDHGPDVGIAALLAKVERERARTSAPIAPTEPTVSTDGEAFADVLNRITSATQTPALSDTDDAVFRSYAETFNSPSQTSDAGPPSRSEDTSSVDTAPAVRGRRERRTPAIDQPGTSTHERLALERLGLPAHLLGAPLSALDRKGALAELAATFPAADPLKATGNDIIALIGDRQGMDRAVTWVYNYLHLKREQMAIASRRESTGGSGVTRLTDGASAERFRKAWARRSQPSLVAIEHSVGLADSEWALRLLDALQPSAVWGVVSASRKPEDVVEWSAQLRGVDAIVLDGTHETTSPAAIVGTGLPVSLIDGMRATPTRWAAVLDARLQAA